jgi:hypothetical protein
VHEGGVAEHPANSGRTPAKERLLDTRGQAQDGDARNIINARRAGNVEARAAAGYHPRRGGRYDSGEDRAPTLERRGTRVFSREILSYGPPWAHYLGGYQDRLLGGPLGLPGLRYTAPEGVEHKDYTGVVLG